MSVIHYKFKSAKNTDTITFDANSLSVYDLKREIMHSKRLARPHQLIDFDLIISDAQTGEVYADEMSMITRNASVIVRRVPVYAKSRYLSGSSASVSGGKAAINASANATTLPLNPSASAGAAAGSAIGLGGTEAEKIEALVNTAAVVGENATDPLAMSSRNKRAKLMAAGSKAQQSLPPPNYKCHRCGSRGNATDILSSANPPPFARPFHPKLPDEQRQGV